MKKATGDSETEEEEEEEALKDIEAAVELLPSLAKERVKTPKKKPPSRKKNKTVVENSLVTAEVTDHKELEGKPENAAATEPAISISSQL